MEEAIKNFPQQFLYEPEIINADKLQRKEIFIVLGMGGSHLAADLLAAYKPDMDIIVHSDYGLPFPETVLQNAFVIASSYSGNTEEVLDGLKIALEKKLPAAAIAIGGKLIEEAKKNNIPYVQMPDTGIQPRSALGFSLRGLLKIMGDEKTLAETKKLAALLSSEEVEKSAKELSAKLRGFVPVIYASRRNAAIAYNWKIKLNETSKIPAFCNFLPELNHNEMTGFDATDTTEKLSRAFHFIILKDSSDHPQNIKRSSVLAKLYRDRGLEVTEMELTGQDRLHKIFSSLQLADWTAYYLSLIYGTEAEQVPMVEEFKKLIA
mgnify:CR=1 FL=1